MIFFFVIRSSTTSSARPPAATSFPTGWSTTDNFSQVKFIIAGVASPPLVVFRPQGIFGDRREQVFDVR